MSEKPLFLRRCTFDPPKSPLKRGTLGKFSALLSGTLSKLSPLLSGTLSKFSPLFKLRCTHKFSGWHLKLSRPLNPPILGDFETPVPPKVGGLGGLNAAF
jgi:hypothetical protein